MTEKSNFPTITVKKNAAYAVAAKHPWLRAESIENSSEDLVDGSIVEVVDPEGKWLGRGMVNTGSFLRVRLYCWNKQEEIGGSLWEKRFSDAIKLRKMTGLWDNDGGCRVVFSESDQLSGVVVDRFGKHFVMNLTAMVMAFRMGELADAFVRSVDESDLGTLIVQTDKNMLSAEKMEAKREIVKGQLPKEPVSIKENGLEFFVDLESGQKTGFFLDQKENRRIAGELAFGDVLDLCCYSGGFALNAAKNPNVQSVTAVDVSMPALELAEKNRIANGLKEIDFVKSDCFSFLDHIKEENRKFDTIVLDPPKFAGRRQEIPSALRAYHRLNYQAIKQIRPEGILVTCSCSGRVSMGEFQNAVLGAAKRAGRQVQLIESRGPNSDHPTLFSCPESSYLKCLICRVM